MSGTQWLLVIISSFESLDRLALRMNEEIERLRSENRYLRTRARHEKQSR